MGKIIISEILDHKGKLGSITVKLALSILSLACSPWHIGFYDGCPWWNHIIYNFFHVNIFHLAINLMVLWSIKNEISVIKSIAVAILVSFFPMYINGHTMGLSGFLFAAFGIMWGKTGRWLDATKKAMPFILCTMLIHNVNGLLHLYAFVVGFLIQYIITKTAAYHK